MIATIPKDEYAARRAALLKKMVPNSVALIFAANPAYRSGHSEYAFRQNSDFYYLTGFNESNAILVLSKEAETKTILFNQTYDANTAQWTGACLGQERAVSDYGMDAAFSIEKVDEQLPALLVNKTVMYFPWGDASIRERMSKWIQQARASARYMEWPDLTALQKLTANMRLIKTPAEIRLMQQSAEISANAHVHAMTKVRPDMYEYQLAAEYVYQFTLHGARDVAYLPIVGGGKNACVLHYTANSDVLRDGDLVLVDAGGEYQNYCADISRTFPVNGRFTPEQRALYDVVLNAYLAGLSQIKPKSEWKNVQNSVIEVLTEGLLELGLLSGKRQELIDQQAYKQFFMHSPGHWIGLDVHDVGAYQTAGKPTLFAKDMVVTLEPGLYISADDRVDKKWWNIGIRIEDDILITANGHQVLSQAAPILPDDIEQLMR